MFEDFLQANMLIEVSRGFKYAIVQTIVDKVTGASHIGFKDEATV